MVPVLFDLRTGAFTRQGQFPLMRGTRPYRLFTVLLAAKGAWISNTEAVEAIYPDPDSEPEAAERTLYETVDWLRRWLAGTGWRIDNWYGFGYRLTRAPD